MKIRVHYIKPVAMHNDKPHYLTHVADFEGIEKITDDYGQIKLIRKSEPVAAFGQGNVIYWEEIQ